MNCETKRFDYREPDYSFLEPSQNALFFSSHSIEQIPHLERDVFDRMFDRTDECIGVHLEPVGWQRDPNLKDLVEAGTWPEGDTVLTINNPSLLRNSARWAENNGYNTNLLELLDELEKEGLIKIVARAYDIFGTNPFNPSTLIIWKKLRD